jgi:hypothetical protein
MLTLKRYLPHLYRTLLSDVRRRREFYSGRVPLPLADGFLASARSVRDLIARPEVADSWERESACAGMTTGGLADHLATQLGTTVRLIAAEPSSQPPLSLAEHYRRAAWVHSGPDEPANTEIRDSSNKQARVGSAALLDQVATDLTALPGTLAAAATRTPDAVLVPWQGWALTTADFLLVRMMEMVVHSDDLAASVGVPTPEFPGDVVAAVLGLLTEVAVERHGQTALVRALARPQRAPAHVSAFGG